jgi:ankyrin repeat protein
MRLLSLRGLGILVLGLGAGAFALASDAPVADAVAKGDLSAVRSLISQHGNVNLTQVDGSTALLWAARNDDMPAAKLLIAAGADVKIANRYGITALSEAATNGSGAMVELLLKGGADANTELPEGDTALMLAAKTGAPEAIKALLAHGAKVNVKESWHGETPLMLAAGENHAEAVKLLIAGGADVNAAATHIEIPEMKKGPGQVFSVYPAGGLTALMEAARENAIESAQALIDGKADLNRKNPQGLSAAMIAILNGHWSLAKVLIDHGSDVNDGSLPLAADVKNLDFLRPAQDRVETVTALDVIEDMLDKGAKPDSTLPGPIPVLHNFGTNVKGPVDSTALYRAAKASDVTVVKLLIAKGADVKKKAKDDTTALHAAVGIGVPQPMGDAALKSPKAPQVIATMKLLMEQGADINAVDGAGMTPMHGAAQRGLDEVVQFLFDNGSKLDVKDKRERTPLDIANGIPGKGKENDEAMVGRYLEKHPSTVALLRKLMGLPAEDPNAKPASGKDKPVESAKVESAAGDK